MVWHWLGMCMGVGSNLGEPKLNLILVLAWMWRVNVNPKELVAKSGCKTAHNGTMNGH